MSSDQQSDVPGSYFVGRPTNHSEKTEEPPHAGGGGGGGEENPATAEAPGGYFIGRPESHNKQEAVTQQTTTKQSTPSFLAKCCPCLVGGGAAE